MENQPTTFRDEVSQNEPNNEWRSLVALALIGIILGFIIGYFVFIKNIFNPFAGNNGEVATSTTETVGTKNATSTIQTAATTANMAVEAPDQAPSLRTQINKLSLAEGAWVVTFTSTEDKSRPNLIIGAQYFSAGNYQNISSYLAEGLVAGEKYFVALYQDDADKTSTVHNFDSTKDKPFTKNGYWVMDSFDVLPVGARG